MPRQKKQSTDYFKKFFKWLIHGPNNPSTVDVVFACMYDEYLCRQVEKRRASSHVNTRQEKVINPIPAVK